MEQQGKEGGKGCFTSYNVQAPFALRPLSSVQPLRPQRCERAEALPLFPCTADRAARTPTPPCAGEFETADVQTVSSGEKLVKSLVRRAESQLVLDLGQVWILVTADQAVLIIPHDLLRFPGSARLPGPNVPGRLGGVRQQSPAADERQDLWIVGVSSNYHMRRRLRRRLGRLRQQFRLKAQVALREGEEGGPAVLGRAGVLREWLQLREHGRQRRRPGSSALQGLPLEIGGILAFHVPVDNREGVLKERPKVPDLVGQLLCAHAQRLGAHVDQVDAHVQKDPVLRLDQPVQLDDAPHHLGIVHLGITVEVEEGHEPLRSKALLRHAEVQQQPLKIPVRVVVGRLDLLDAERAVVVRIYRGERGTEDRAFLLSVLPCHHEPQVIRRLRRGHRVLHDVRDRRLHEAEGDEDDQEIEEHAHEPVLQDDGARDVVGPI
mmetsp:Transcript_11050/g.29473  ORF Transcript_11050/g.29473 Transcript_11050/m.29473 type:complete len:435 (+) Transcript_11050:128-1432(+)